MTSIPALSKAPFPDAPAALEEACVAGPGDVAAMLLFALSRRREGDDRPVLMAAPRAWFIEHGRPYGPGLPDIAFVLTPTATPAEALWVLEQGLRSGAVSLALGAVDGASLTQTRRLGFAATQGEATGLLIPRTLDGLSAASRRWRIATAPSAVDPDDPRAPGPVRLIADLVRARAERPGAWMLEQDDETHRLRLADRLADFGPPPIAGTGAASGLAA
ncbi:ImuA family protein [Brevundimonas sp. NPDC092305]|uniref:ImuA family protein n=1 Tax=Brevundimonas sp. NPDC092305 TaxID=3363957 RepID=UPI0037FE2B89